MSSDADCPACGTGNQAGARYCRGCGTPLRSPGAARTSKTLAVGSLPAAGKAPSLGSPSPLLRGHTGAPADTGGSPGRTGFRPTALIVAVVAVLLATAAVVVLAFVVFDRGGSGPAAEEAASESPVRRSEPDGPTGVAGGSDGPIDVVPPSPTSASTTSLPGPSLPPVVTGTVARTCGADGRSDCFLSVRTEPTSHAPELRRIAEGQPIEVVCQVPGQPARSSVLGRSVPVWARTPDGRYVANVFVDAPGFDPVSLNRPCP